VELLGKANHAAAEDDRADGLGLVRGAWTGSGARCKQRH